MVAWGSIQNYIVNLSICCHLNLPPIQVQIYSKDFQSARGICTASYNLEPEWRIAPVRKEIHTRRDGTIVERTMVLG